MKKIIITIDGHSACGKSTLARQLAEKLNYGYIDTGAMYRAVTYYFLENRVNVQKSREVEAGLKKIDIQFRNSVAGNRTILNGIDVEDTIRKMFVSKSVSHVAAMSAVRKKVVKQQQEMGKQKGIVMEGRDIGTVVFPNAELKLFLTADEEVRTQRRFDEIKSKGQNVSSKAIKANLKERDHLDSTRKDSPLKQAKDAVIIDNSNLTQKEQLAMAFALATERISALDRAAKIAAKKSQPAKKTPPRSQKTSTKKSTPRPTAQKTKSGTPKPNNRNTTQSKPTAQQTKRSSNTRKPQPQKEKARSTKPTPKSNNRNTTKAKPATTQTNRSSNTRKQQPQKEKARSTKSAPKTNNRNTTKPKPATPQTNRSSNARRSQKNKPETSKTKSTKPQQKKVKPQSKDQKSNNTSTKSKPQPKRKPQPTKSKKTTNYKKQHSPKPKTKQKINLEDSLDDFSF